MSWNRAKHTIFICLCTLALTSALAQDASISCANCSEWNQPQTPFRIFGNTYYVGTHALTSLLITSKAGHVLIDGDLPQSASQITANIQALGFQIKDVKLIVNSHAHFDHAGGIAELQRLSGARVVASAWSAKSLQEGRRGARRSAIWHDPWYRAGSKRRHAPRRRGLSHRHNHDHCSPNSGTHTWRHELDVEIVRRNEVLRLRLCG
jgi:phosphoribosyl 1,2-cyclic phosphodiesterase